MTESSTQSPRLPRALVLAGGWEGHRPEAVARFAMEHLLQGFQVTRHTDLEVLSATKLKQFDLLLPIWTFGQLSEEQEQALCEAVEQGLGLVAWHGAASSFQTNRRYKHLLGGQFVAHPGGEHLRYPVRFEDDPLCAGLQDFEVTSEQYYLMTDPAVTVLATTNVASDEMPWLHGVKVPAAWRRQWGAGRVFYYSLGHTVSVLQQPGVAQLLRRAIEWATRTR